MSTWISKLALALMLAATPVAAQQAVPRSPEKMLVQGRQVMIAGPKGYCVDPRGSSDRPEGAFVLLGHCAALGGKRGNPQPKARAVFTATVMPRAPGAAPLQKQFPQMAEFFRSEAGAKALSRAGKARTVRVLSASSVKNVFFLHATDSSAGKELPVDPTYWRAIFELKGHIVTLTTFALADSGLPAQAQRELLDDFLKRVRAVND